MRRLVREHCDEVAALPLFGHVTSLNVSVAAGAVMYEVVRQRGTMPSHVRPIPPSARPPAPTQITGPAADDGESDPGLLPPAPPAEASDEEDEAPNLSLVQIHEGEDAAWRLPAVGPPSERRVTRNDGREPSRERGRGDRDRGDRDRGDRGDRRGRRDRPAGGHKSHREERPADAPPPAPRSPEDGAPGDAAPEARGDRPPGDRRRRRRRRRGGRPPGADANGSPERANGANGHPNEHSGGGGDRDAEPGNGSDDPASPRSENGAPPAGGAPNGAPGAGSDARRRRRRRRRH